MATHELTESQREWLRVRAYLQENRHALSELAAARYPDVPKVADTTLLSNQAWLPDEAIPLQSIELTWTPDFPRASLFPSDDLIEHLRPLTPAGTRYASYSAAMADLAAPAVFQNRTTYRLRSAHLSSRSPRMDFEQGRYFDGIDVGEACAHELAAHALGLVETTPLRDAIGDPCRPSRRPMSIAIAALTLRHDRHAGAATFPLHWRDPAKVGHAGGTQMVIPVGVFQAVDDEPARQQSGLSFWECLMREYSEEMLGLAEGDVAAGAVVRDRMHDGLTQGRVRALVLGMGVDPLTLATDLLAVVAIDSHLYDELFTAAVNVNSEGRLVENTSGGAVEGRFPFLGDEIERLSREGKMQSAAEAALRLAWSRLGPNSVRSHPTFVYDDRANTRTSVFVSKTRSPAREIPGADPSETAML